MVPENAFLAERSRDQDFFDCKIEGRFGQPGISERGKETFKGSLVRIRKRAGTSFVWEKTNIAFCPPLIIHVPISPVTLLFHYGTTKRTRIHLN